LNDSRNLRCMDVGRGLARSGSAKRCEVEPCGFCGFYGFYGVLGWKSDLMLEQCYVVMDVATGMGRPTSWEGCSVMESY